MVFFFKQDPGTRLFQTKPGKWFPMGIFVFCLNLLTQNTVSGSLLVQYFFRSAWKFIVDSYECFNIVLENPDKNQTRTNPECIFKCMSIFLENGELLKLAILKQLCSD